MNILYDLHDSSLISTYQKNCKEHLWARINEKPHGVIIKSIPDSFKKYGTELIFDKKILIATDEWWDEIDKNNIRTNEYIGILYHAGKCDRFNSITITTVNDGHSESWTIQNWLPDYSISIGKIIKIIYAPCITNFVPGNSSPHKFIIRVEIED